MNRKIIEAAAREFINTGDDALVERFKVKGADNVYYTVTFEKHSQINEKLGMESLSNTISALPPGGVCNACGGSGRAS